MKTRFKVACVQNCAGPEIEPNLAETAALTRQAAGEGAELICLPEYFSCLDLKDNLILGQPFPEESHPALARFQDLASELSVHILLGSLAVESGEARFFNRSYGAKSKRRIDKFVTRLANEASSRSISQDKEAYCSQAKFMFLEIPTTAPKDLPKYFKDARFNTHGVKPCTDQAVAAAPKKRK